MSNKTSDKNVANIEDDIKLVKRYLENSAYKETDSDFFKNGGWEIIDLEIPRAMENILAELEQKDKRIKELEKENKNKDTYIKMAKEVIENSIPKQKIKDKIEELKQDKESKYYDSFLEERDIEKTIEFLQELLQEEAKNEL